MNYRNTAQIMAVACEFARDLLSAKEAEEDAIPLVAPQSAGRGGSLSGARGDPCRKSTPLQIAALFNCGPLYPKSEIMP